MNLSMSSIMLVVNNTDQREIRCWILHRESSAEQQIPFILKWQPSRTLNNTSPFVSAPSVQAKNVGQGALTLPLKKTHSIHVLCDNCDSLTSSRFSPITLNWRQNDNGYPCKWYPSLLSSRIICHRNRTPFRNVVHMVIRVHIRRLRSP